MSYKSLKLLTEQEEAYGLICEWNTRRGCSGEISNDIQDLSVINRILAESDEKITKDHHSIFMNCILQKCDTENRNGRYYPKHVLEREDRNYQSLISEGRAGGECNHPDCYLPDTEILTSNGWKLFSEIGESESVLTLNQNSNLIEEHKINLKIDKLYTGEMYHFKGLNIDLVVTPNHNFLVEDRSGKRFFKTAKEIENSYSNKWKILKKGDWIGKNDEFYIIPGIKSNEYISTKINTVFRKKFSEDISIESKTWFSFLGLYLAEGSALGSKSKKYGHGYVSKITQKKTENILLIRELLSNLPFKIREKVYKNGKVDFLITDIRLHKYLLKLGDSYNKYIPEDIKKYSPELLKLLFNWFKMGDGRTIGERNQSDVFSTSEKLIEDLHEVLIKSGGCGNIRKEERGIDRYITDEIEEEVEEYGELVLVKRKIKRLIKGINTKPMFFLNISKSKNIWLDKRFIEIKKIPYSGKIYCVNVTNHIIYVKRNGKAFWCGNSSNIDIKNLSHRVIKSWWEGNTLLGVLEIMTSKIYHTTGQICCTGDIVADLLRRGYKLGISSRGVGSLKNINGKNTVQDDFELICYDLVASPSTPGAFLYPESEVKLNEEIESGNIKIINNKLITNLNKFLN